MNKVIVKIKCHACGSILIQDPKDVSIHWTTNETLYKYYCESCGSWKWETANEKQIQVMQLYGVAEYDARAMDIESKPEIMERFTPDDFLDLHELLAEDDWMSGLEKLVEQDKEDA